MKHPILKIVILIITSSPIFSLWAQGQERLDSVYYGSFVNDCWQGSLYQKYQYNSKGQLERMYFSIYSQGYTYDEKGNQTEFIRYQNDTTKNVYIYDENNNCLSITPYILNREVWDTNTSGYIYTYEYANNQLSKQTIYDYKTGRDPAWVTIRYNYYDTDINKIIRSEYYTTSSVLSIGFSLILRCI